MAVASGAGGAGGAGGGAATLAAGLAAAVASAAVPPPQPATLRVPQALAELQKTAPERMEANVGPVMLLRFASGAAQLEEQDPAVQQLLGIVKYQETRTRKSLDHGIRARAKLYSNQ